jgi:hypothetical protein
MMLVSRTYISHGCFLAEVFLGAIEQEKKDKIGERVAALQQLVSPFGKVYFSSFRCNNSCGLCHPRKWNFVLQALQSPLLLVAADRYGFCSAGSIGLHQVPAPATRGLYFCDRKWHYDLQLSDPSSADRNGTDLFRS